MGGSTPSPPQSAAKVCFIIAKARESGRKGREEGRGFDVPRPRMHEEGSRARRARRRILRRPSRIDISRRSTPMVPGRFLPASNIARLAENTGAPVFARLLILQTDARGSCNLACVCPAAVKHARVRFPLLRSRVALAPRKKPAEIRDFLGPFNEITFEGRTAAAYARDN